jgi:hypothetical protein
MPSDASPPNRPSRLAVVRRAAAERRFPTPFRILWWVGAFLPSLMIVCELIGVLKIRDYPFINPLSTLIVSVIICASVSYSQRRDVGAQLIDFSFVMLLSLLQITLIGALAYWLKISPALVS